jgi:diphosphoinositol-polyphosphate diphosphatase
MTFDDARDPAGEGDGLPELSGVTLVPQAGAIAVRIGTGEPRVLLVTSRRHPEHWIFPKGGLEPDETPAEAAVRELVEEGGVEGEVIAPAGTLEMAVDDEVLRVEYYLVRAGREVGSSEARERRWCTLKEAAGLLSFVTLRDMLARVWPLVARR